MEKISKCWKKIHSLCKLTSLKARIVPEMPEETLKIMALSFLLKVMRKGGNWFDLMIERRITKKKDLQLKILS